MAALSPMGVAALALPAIVACGGAAPTAEPQPEGGVPDTAVVAEPFVNPEPPLIPAIDPDERKSPVAPGDSLVARMVSEAVGSVAHVRVCAGGDVMLGNNLDTLWARRTAARTGRPVIPRPDPDSLLAPLRPLVRDADIVLLNIEGAIGEGAAPPKCRAGSRNCYAFRQDVAAALALRRFAAPAAMVGNVANNHAMDAGLSGFRSTVRNLSLAGVHVTGDDTLAVPVVTERGDTVAFLGFSTSQAGPDPRDLAAVSRHVARAAGRYRRVIVTAHMGAEGADAQRTRDETESYLGENRGNVVAFARTAVDAGAAAVFAHGPHVLRAAEWRDDAVIFYSLGNLLTYGPFSLHEPLNRGAIACAALDRSGRVSDVALRSTQQFPPGVVAVDPSARAAVLVDSLAQLDFPDTRVAWLSEAVASRPLPGDSARR